MEKDKLLDWNTRHNDSTVEEILRFCTSEFNGNAVFSSSLGLEDQVLTHYIAANNLNISIFTLDTGRLHQETYSLIERTKEKYSITITAFFPTNNLVEEMVNTKGFNLFYESIENRKLCCHIRKIEPLKRALNAKTCWITGLRKEQSEFRSGLQIFEWDKNFNIVKVNPLLNKTEKEIWEIIHKYHIPYNKLHDKNYHSIGCLPCTRAVEPGSNLRSGRWWWEETGHKECGLHHT